MGYIIPKDECTLTDLRGFREGAIQAGKKTAVDYRIAQSEDQLTVRGFECIADAGAGVDGWLTAALAAVGTEYSMLQAIATLTVPSNKLFVFYGIGCEAAPVPVSILRFRMNAVAGNIKQVFTLERLINALTPEAYFNQPVVFVPNSIFAANVVARIATAAAESIQLYGFVVEPIGPTVA